MNKKIILVGIVFLLIVVGLSGCNESDNNSSNSAISIEELNDHLAKYIGKEITVDGYLLSINEFGNQKMGSLVDNPEYPTYTALLRIPGGIEAHRRYNRVTGIIGENYDLGVMAVPEIQVTSIEPQ